MRIIIGIDPGLASTGYGVINTSGNKLSHIAHGVIRTDPDMANALRLKKIYSELKKIIKTYKPDEAGIEKIFFARNARTAMPVAEAKGVIKLCLAQNGLECYEYTPLEVKQAVLGRGSAEKQQIKKMIKIIFKLKEIPQYDHEADALAVALCHSNCSNLKNIADPGKKKNV